jgi:hypothetical protein
MAGKQRTTYGFRAGDSPPAGHWAAGIAGFSRAAYLAAGFDSLAEKAGAENGLSLLLASRGLRLGQVLEATPEQVRDWYYDCYAEHSGERLAGAWDVVSFSAGLYSFNSGGCPGRPHQRLRARLPDRP